MLTKIIELVKQYQRDIFLLLCIVLISVISFNLGKINGFHKEPIKIKEGANIYQAQSLEGMVPLATHSASPSSSVPSSIPKPKVVDLRVVVSKKSKTKLYHFTWCSGAKRIAAINQRWFNSEQEAIQTGYKLASNCNK